MDYRDFLTNELERRRTRNARYSLRAFAKSLGLSAATMCEVLSRKRRLRRDSIAKISARLNLNAQDRAAFTLSALGIESLSAGATVALTHREYQALSEDCFRSVADWAHFAILSMADLPRQAADPDWIGQRLGIGRRGASGRGRVSEAEPENAVGGSRAAGADESCDR